MVKFGYNNFFNRIKYLFTKAVVSIALFPSALLFSLAIYALRKIVFIQIVIVENSRIGHFCANTEVSRCRRIAGIINNKNLDIFYIRTPACNSFMKKVWERTIPVVDRNDLVRVMINILSVLPGGNQHYLLDADIVQNPARDTDGLLAQLPCPFSFTSEEVAAGKHALSRMGIPDHAPYVCIHARDPAYLLTKYPKRDPTYWSYQDYRDFSIDDMIPAAEELTRRGYYVIRMGSVVQNKMPTSNPMIIDYACSEFQSEFLDVYIIGTCSFMVSGTAGIYAIAEVFRRPFSFVNFIPLEHAHTWNPNPFIFKKVREKNSKRVLSIREMMETGAGCFQHSEEFEKAGLEVINNTPEEIAEVSLELCERLEGTWQSREEDEVLQMRFWEIFRKYVNPELHGVYRARVGAEFLRKNRYLIE